MTYKCALHDIPFGGRQGRHQVQPARLLGRRAGADHPPLHLRAGPEHRPRARHPRPRRGHQRPGHGLDDGHLRQPGRLRAAARGPRRGDRQDHRRRRLARPRAGHRPGHRPLHHRVGPRRPLRAQRRHLRGAGLRQRRLARVEDPRPHRRLADRGGRLEGLHLERRGHQPLQAVRVRPAHRQRGRLPRHPHHPARAVLRHRGGHP
jgi:hypothetical protein